MTVLEKTLAIARQRGLFYAMGLVAAVLLKWHYSTADADDLRWILAPIARLVTFLTGISFEYELRMGFLSRSHNVIIAPACAGINFLIICFSALFFPLLSRFEKRATRFTWLALSLCASYMITLCVNTLRIIISIYLYGAHIYNGWITPERVHRLEGILVYVCFLIVVYLAAERLTRRRPAAAPLPIVRALCVPLAWYVLIAVVIPLLNVHGSQRGPGFTEHIFVISVVNLCIFHACLLVSAVLKRRKDARYRLWVMGKDKTRF